MQNFFNDIPEGGVGIFEDNSDDFVTVTILPRFVVDTIVAAASLLSFSDDIAGNIGDNAFGGVSDVNLRDRGDIKLPSRYQSFPSKQSSSPPFKPSFSNGPGLVRLLRIKQEDIGVTI